jgi:hypothetical protein
MPKKKRPETPEEQAERFKREAEMLIEAGELDPERGSEALDKLVKNTTSGARRGTDKSTKC